MASPLPRHGRLSKQTLTNSPARSSPLIRPPSTPYDAYRQRHPIHQGDHMGATSQSTSRSVFVEHDSPRTYAAYRRNAGFGSPGMTAVRSPRTIDQTTNGSQDSDHVNSTPPPSRTFKAKPFIRRKSWKKKIQEAPGVWWDRILFSEYLDFGNPAIGYPLGIALHVASLLVLIMHPEGTLRIGRTRSGRSSSSLFANEQTGNGGLSLRRRQQQDAAWRWSANLLFLLVIIAVLSNAYHLFNARRRYHLWLKPTSEGLASENAKLVNLPSDVPATVQKTWHELAVEAAHEVVHRIWRGIVWMAKKALYRIRLIRYVGAVVRFFFPPASGRAAGRRPTGPVGQQMHALDVWQAPEVPLRIVTLYSPLHLCVYFYNLHAGRASRSGKAYTLLISVLLMGLVSMQTAVLRFLYAGLVKDRDLIAGEVLNEYNQKFVMPRAMPVCRDASTMTMQSEMLGPDDFRPLSTSRHTTTETQTKSRSPPSSSTSKSTSKHKKGRATAA